MQTNNDKTLIERVTMVSRAALLVQHALTDLCADYLRAVAIIHASELSAEQAETIEDVAQYFEGFADEVQHAVAHLNGIFESKQQTKAGANFTADNPRHL